MEFDADETKGLWQAVIMQAFLDAKSRSVSDNAVLMRGRAIRWLLGMGEDFVEVCIRAGFEPEYINSNAIKMFGKKQKVRGSTLDEIQKRTSRVHKERVKALKDYGAPNREVLL